MMATITPDGPTSLQRTTSAEEAVADLLDRMERADCPLLVEAILYRQLYYRGCRMDGINSRVDKLAREGR